LYRLLSVEERVRLVSEELVLVTDVFAVIAIATHAPNGAVRRRDARTALDQAKYSGEAGCAKGKVVVSRT
jgi:hypothetical protein